MAESTSTATAAATAPARPALDKDLLTRLAAAAGDDADGLRRRLAVLDRWESVVAPDRVRHLWRFTNPVQLLPARVAVEAASAAARQPLAATMSGAVATIDLWPGQSPVITLAPGLPAGALNVGPAAGADVLAGGASAADRELFAALNDAAWNGGVGLVVADGVTLPGPIHVRIHAVAAATLPRVTLTVGRGSEAVLLEQHLDGGPEVRVGGRTVVRAAAGARVRHAVIQVWAAGTSGHLAVDTRAEESADVLTVFGAFGGEAAKLELRTDLAGAGAHSEIVGVTFVASRQHGDVHTSHRHLAERTTSRIDFKAVAADQARTTYTGLIRIEDDAPHCEAFQENRNLLLSPRARADAIPELEIHNQEVSCSHGATIAPVAEDQLFYLESRGLDRGEALGLVVAGFLENTLARLPGDARALVESFVGPRLASIREGQA
ncbi:MAG: SufD family Fe-S cluster assembly protein [bacterium]|nr:SufD family Fe-S cluster assembly protein [bacterium]